MEIAHIRQICDWVAQTDITEFELSGPGLHLFLRNARAAVPQIGVQPAAAVLTASAGPAAAEPEVVRAGSVGVFLRQHPQQTVPIVAAGANVRAMQPLGLLQIGPLLLPVTAPCDAVVHDMPVPDGTVVGWGTPLVVLGRCTG